jgi:hypothetical protein
MLGLRNTPYTMLMGRKGAILILMFVALWAAAPVLACLALAPCHPCCKTMMMDCDSATIAAHPCCQVQSSNTAVPPGQGPVTSVFVGSSQTLISVNLADLPAGAVRGPGKSEAPPPRPLCGASTILRI